MAQGAGRLPLSSKSAHKPQKSGGWTVGGWAADDLTGRNRSRIPGWRWLTRSRSGKYVRWAAGIVLTVLMLFFHYKEVHVEIQVYSKRWVQHTIEPTPFLSGHCFAPPSLARSSYNLSLARAPKFVDVHAGMGMPLGNDCFAFAATIPREPVEGMQLPEHTIFHTYWRDDLKPLSERQVDLLESLLATQDRESTSVTLWTNAATPDRLKQNELLAPLIRRYGFRLRISSLSKAELAKGTPMEGHKLLSTADKKAWLDGDIVRVLVLWAEGGVWVDMDTIMTGRDIRPLLEHEWVTQWDCYDKIYQQLNGAMMHFFKHSPYLCEMLHIMATDPAPRPSSTDWGSIMYHKLFRRLLAAGQTPFKILPYCFTDGSSCKITERLPSPFEKDPEWKAGSGRERLLEMRVASAWAVHLHNQWDKTFTEGGWVRRLIIDRVREAAKEY